MPVQAGIPSRPSGRMICYFKSNLVLLSEFTLLGKVKSYDFRNKEKRDHLLQFKVYALNL